jgi:endogenous inhibitor of DNA gyrase (YacG/DUF329 family)
MKPRGSATPRNRVTLTCSICGQPFSLDQTTAAPFCSGRCKSIDLGRWLDEEIGVPHEGGPDNVEQSPLDQEDAD